MKVIKFGDRDFYSYWCSGVSIAKRKFLVTPFYTMDWFAYTNEYYSSENLSFILVENYIPIALCYAYVGEDCYAPLILDESRNFFQIVNICVEELYKRKVKSIFYYSYLSKYYTTFIFKGYEDKKINTKLLYRNGKVKYRSELRSSYNSLINNIHRNYFIDIYTSKNITSKVFESYKSIHQVLTRTTRKNEKRNEKTYLIQYMMIKNDIAYLVVVQNEKEVFGCYFFLSYGNTTYYASAATIPNAPDGIGHAGLYNGIQHNDKSIMDFGCMHYDSDDSKVKNIDFFKKGFAKIEIDQLGIKL